MFLAYYFNSLDFVTATIFSKSLAILSVTFFSRNFDTYKFISPTNLKDQNKDHWDYIEKF